MILRWEVTNDNSSMVEMNAENNNKEMEVN